MIPSRYVVDVRNGSNADGLGSQVMTLVRGQGFLRGTVDTTGRADESVVYYTAADEDAAEQLAAHLGGIATAEVDEGVSPGPPPGGARRRLRPDARPRAQHDHPAAPDPVDGADHRGRRALRELKVADVRSASSAQRRSDRAMTTRWIWLVPS